MRLGAGQGRHMNKQKMLEKEQVLVVRTNFNVFHVLQIFQT